ncbi:MAG: hypothetical protein ABSE72_11930 [Bacteroidales bacterium]|jgi:hypothetical protein
MGTDQSINVTRKQETMLHDKCIVVNLFDSSFQYLLGINHPVPDKIMFPDEIMSPQYSILKDDDFS